MKKIQFKSKVVALMTSVVMLSVTLSATIPVQAFGPSTMYTTPSNISGDGALSPRVVQLQYSGANNNKMYCTFEQTALTGTKPVFPIYESTDNGVSWAQVGKVQDTQNSYGMMDCPQLFEMPQTIGSLTAGTLICVGNSGPSDFSSTYMDMYKSTDLGRTWTFVSRVATANTGSSNPIWEPFVMVYNNKLMMFYSDERDGAHNQKLVHETSTDGINWSSPVDDVALANSNLRPGMATIAKMGNGNYAMTFEVFNESGTPCRIKTSSNPESWNPTDEGSIIGYGGSPVLTALGDGRIALQQYARKEILINSSRVDNSGSWIPYNPPVNAGYNRCLLPLTNGRLFITSCPIFGSNQHNVVTYGDMSLGYYKLVNVKSGKTLGVNGGGTTNGSQLSQWTSSTNSLDQYWLVTNVAGSAYSSTGGYKKIINAKSGKAIAINNALTTDGASAVLWSDTGANEQQWTLQPSGSNYKIVDRNSGKCLGISGGSTTDGANAVQWTDNGGTDQLWQLVPDSGQINVNTYRFVNVKSGEVLGINGGSTAAGKNAVQWTYGNASCDQNWYINDMGNGYNKIVDANSLLPISVAGASTTDGANIIQNTDQATNEFQWSIVQSGSYYKIVNRNSGKVIGISGGSTTNGANAVQWTDSGSTDQLWQIVAN